MKFISAIAFQILLVCLISCLEEENKVLILEEKSYFDEIYNYDYLMVMHYLPNNEQSLFEEYEKAAEILRNENPPLYIAKLDASKITSEFKKRFFIVEYPVYIFYQWGKKREYSGLRSHEEIVNWFKDHIEIPTKQLVTREDVEDLLLSNYVVCIYFGEPGSHDYRKFAILSKNFDDIKFSHIVSGEVAQHYEVKLGQILLLKNGDKEKNIYEEPITIESLKHFIELYSIPIVSKFDDRMADLIIDKNRLGFFLVRSSLNDKHLELDPIVKTLALKYRGKLIFIITDIFGEDLEEKFAELLGITEKNLPLIRIIDVKEESDERIYAMEEEMTESNINQFIQDFFDGKLTPFIESEEIPTKQTGPVIKVVAKNFHEAVINNKKHVFIMFYSPADPNYQIFDRIFDQLANMFINNTDIMFSKMDATKNDIEYLRNVNDYPAYALYNGNDKSIPIDYKNENTYDELLKFVRIFLYPEENKDNIQVDDQFKDDGNFQADRERETRVDL